LVVVALLPAPFKKQYNPTAPGFSVAYITRAVKNSPRHITESTSPHGGLEE
jgi:hypothetical protein